MRYVLSTAICLASACTVLSDDFVLEWATIDAGGVMSATDGQPDGFVLSSTIGQPDAAPVAMTGGGYTLTGGFWAGVSGGVEPCPGDLDGDNDVDISDLAQLLAHYGTTSGATYEDGDIDGDGDVDLPDLAALLAVYGTACE